ncbi:hypothetical protein K438DRAFT_555911 [Mycena galopus ATCC 62051]|nr:hypothetical protein K438DRAFT_555911 [Mycena galopus ATCC 62051]
MLHSTVRLSTLWNTVVKINPEFTIPPSDPDPTHHFSTRNRRPVNNFGSYASGASLSSLASYKGPSTTPVRTRTPRKPSSRGKACCCACHEPLPTPGTAALETSTPNRHQGSRSRSMKRTRFEEADEVSRDRSTHRKEPAPHYASAVGLVGRRERWERSHFILYSDQVLPNEDHVSSPIEASVFYTESQGTWVSLQLSCSSSFQTF